MADERDKRDFTETPTEQDMSRSGGKHDWRRVVDSMPSSENDDPKDHEPQQDDMSVRGGPFEQGPR